MNSMRTQPLSYKGGIKEQGAKLTRTKGRTANDHTRDHPGVLHLSTSVQTARAPRAISSITSRCKATSPLLLAGHRGHRFESTSPLERSCGLRKGWASCRRGICGADQLFCSSTQTIEHYDNCQLAIPRRNRSKRDSSQPSGRVVSAASTIIARDDCREGVQISPQKWKELFFGYVARQ